jgi:hypothetical protein
MNAIGLALQAQKVFVQFTNFSSANSDVTSCPEQLPDRLCVQESDGTFKVWQMMRADGNKAESTTDLVNTLTSKYGMTQQQIMQGPVDCFNANNQQQLTNPFDKGTLPPDPKAPCVFNVLVCLPIKRNFRNGIIQDCRDNSVPL